MNEAKYKRMKAELKLLAEVNRQLMNPRLPTMLRFRLVDQLKALKEAKYAN